MAASFWVLILSIWIFLKIYTFEIIKVQFIDIWISITLHIIQSTFFSTTFLFHGWFRLSYRSHTAGGFARGDAYFYFVLVWIVLKQ
jgi:hypothetical protein